MVELPLPHGPRRARFRQGGARARSLSVAALALFVFALAPARAQDETAGAGDDAGAWRWRTSGSATLETRLFPTGEGSSATASIAFEPEFFASCRFEGRDEGEDIEQRIVISPFLRLDSNDDERTHFDVRELYWHRVARDFEVMLGVRRVFWGVTESRHLVDFLNQVDLVEDLDAESRLGQPMAQARLVRSWGILDLFVLPGFRERTFPGEDGRPSFGPIDPDDALYASSAGADHVDVAARWSRVLGPVDLGVAAFRGTDREPLFRADPAPPPIDERSAAPRLVPFYDQVERVSVDAQFTRGAWLWKAEAVAQRAEVGEDHVAAVAGFEYTFFDLAGSGVDVGVLGERLVDDRGESAPTPFEDDLFAGARVAWNDVAGTELLVGAIIDRDDGATFWSLEASRRLGDRLRLAVEVRAFTGVEDGAFLGPLRQDDFVRVEISRFF